MGLKYLYDTNAVIDYIGGNFPNHVVIWTEKVLFNQQIAISIINKIEVLGFNAPVAEGLLLEEFINLSVVLQLADSVADKTIELRKSYKIKLPDAIIAATAIVHDLTLISRNDGDFKNIAGLKYLNPFTDL